MLFFHIYLSSMPPKKKPKRGPAPKPVHLELNIDLLEQHPKTKKNPTIKLSDVMYHKIKDKRLHVNVSYDELITVISDYISTLPLHDHDNCHYEIVSLPASSILDDLKLRRM